MRGALSGAGWLRWAALLVTGVSIFSTACGWRPDPVTYPPGTVVAMPRIAPGGGTFESSQRVFLIDATVGSTIYYTVDGTTPDVHSKRYTGAFQVKRSETVKAIAYAPGCIRSAIAVAVFTIETPGDRRPIE